MRKGNLLENGNIKVGFVSLGCSKNLVDTEVMLYRLNEAGYSITADETEADVVIINTCAFIESAKTEAIDNILDIAWLKENRSLRGIVVTGCLAERYRGELLESMPEVDAVLGVGSIHRIAEAVAAVLRGEKFSGFDDKEEVELGQSRIVTTGDAYAYLKIAEGCSNRCTYCAIPSIRGRMRSRTMESIVAEARELCDMGIKELCIIAQDTTSYGIDLYGRLALSELLEKLLAETDFPWIRLLYLYPDRITDRLLSVIRDNPRILPYFDIPVQHISDTVLKRMNRRGDGATVREALAKIRREISGAVLRTTVIVGFPGENEEDFATTLEFAKKCGFAKMHIFPYSKRKGTPAAEMKEQVDEAVKSERAARLAKVDEELHQQMLQSTVGKVEEVLFEQPVDDEHMEGLCGPYLRVVVPGTAELANTIAKVKITGIKEDFLLGELN